MKSKAICLLVIFLLNTVVGLGCALTMEGNHHDENHSHADRHGQKDKPITRLISSTEDHCCKTLVNDLVAQSKLIPDSAKAQVALSFIWLPDFSYKLFAPLISTQLEQRFYVDHRSRPPNEDIRIVIQSFQI
ncbi:hypothetical protein SAMN04487898_10711 [Pedobacter sp. ok626]|uniref:hypothetical protein n=1 Tax=Pedobacter sp. ok626 TaxID=1761882 RepID=UPI00088F7B38|nr:hypothetical protein [Pedobacter sp. ok626]SDK25329.1 hypothetical protein SAMN04487898_10711 [Pedobacter sp. ok626]